MHACESIRRLYRTDTERYLSSSTWPAHFLPLRWSYVSADGRSFRGTEKDAHVAKELAGHEGIL